MDQAEQLRNIIKKQNQIVKTARVITVTSGKGGVGKSSVSVNLGIQMSRLGKKVIIFDADFGLANIEVMLGIRPRYNLADLIYQGKSLEEIITKGPEGIGFISGGSGIQELADVTKEQIQYMVGKLSALDELADIIIIDTGAGITASVLEFIAASQEVLLVTTPEPTSITDAYALLKTLNRKEEFSHENTAVKLVANRVNSNGEGKQLFDKLNLVVEKFLDFKIEYLGSVPYDHSVSKAIMQQKPYSLAYPHSSSSKSIIELAYLLCEETKKENQQNKGIAQFFSYLYHSKLKK